MSEPKRIQRKRTKGWRLPEGAVIVTRPTKWGNDWREGSASWTVGPGGIYDKSGKVLTRADAMASYANAWIHADPSLERFKALAGRDICCWCPVPEPGQPDICHGAFILSAANGWPMPEWLVPLITPKENG